MAIIWIKNLRLAKWPKRSIQRPRKRMKKPLRHRRSLPMYIYQQYMRPGEPVVLLVCPTLQRSYNAAPTVNPDVLRRLDMLSNAQFMASIFNDLSQENRETLMFQEKQRIRTFLHHWEHEQYMSGRAMAAAGFYYLNVADRVQCAFCRGILHQWERGDNPMAEHKSNFPFCRFTKRQECGNQPYHEAVSLTTDAMRNIRITDRSLADLVGNDAISGGNSIADNLGITTVKPSKPEYAPEATRLRTYGQYPIDAKVPKNRLCEAGFYYVGFNDTVKCFFCEGQLKDWAEGDDPWVEHAKWFSDCYFVLSVKGEKFVKQAQGFTADKSKTDSAVVDYKKKQAPVSWIAKYCLDLGHSTQNVNKVIENTKKSFTDPSSMLAVLYELEDNPDMFKEKSSSDGRMETTQSDSEQTLRTASPMLVDNLDPDTRINHMRRFVHGESNINPTTFGMCCAPNCKRNGGAREKADHVGLPCGCLLYCSGCQENAAERCPKCDQIMRGVMKVYTS